jgi:ATP-dependent HslUV protease subunit HslV
MHGTTVLAVQRDGRTAMIGDGQVTAGERIIMKQKAQKVRRLSGGKVLAGFAGATADAFTLLEKLEGRLDEFRGNLTRAAVELARDWRSDRVLRRLEAQLLVADREHILVVTGLGDVVEPDEAVAAIGSGGPFALAAARALLRHTALPAAEVARAAMAVAADICVFTNDHFTLEEL